MATHPGEVDPERAASLGARFIDAGDLAGEVTAIDVAVLGPDTVRVILTVRVDYVFAKAIPGAAAGTEVTARATAVVTAG